MSEPKLCPYLVAAFVPILGKLEYDVAERGMVCLQDKCAMWRDIKTITTIVGGEWVERAIPKEQWRSFCGLSGER